jgi:hypothetical protein
MNVELKPERKDANGISKSQELKVNGQIIGNC